MRVIGLTGGIGVGKSLVSEILAAHGAHIIDADKVGHAIYEPGTAGFQAVVEAFGEEIVDAEGYVDRARLGAKVFGNDAQLRRLTSIVHPLIRQSVEEQIRAARRQPETRAIVLEAAILLDSGWDAVTDEVWVVEAGASEIRSRLAVARGMSEAEVDARAAKQMSNEERRLRADVVVKNYGSPEDLRQEIGRLWQERFSD